MRSVVYLGVLSLVISVAGMACQPAKTGDALVTVGKESITQPDIDLLIKINPRLERRLNAPGGKKQIIDNYVEQSLMYQEARKQGLHNDPLVKAKIGLYDKVILAQSLLEERLEDATKEYYENNPKEFEKVKLAHIYIPYKVAGKNRALDKKAKVTRSEKQAKAIAEKVKAALDKNPADFEAQVAKVSEDARTQKRDGDLGWLTAEDARMKRWGWLSLVEKGFPTAQGKIVGPVQSENGFHILKIVESKKQDSFDEVKPRIRFKVQSQVKSALVKELKEKYPVTYAGEGEKKADAVEKAAASAQPAS